jgi:hypothetical protein
VSHPSPVAAAAIALGLAALAGCAGAKPPPKKEPLGALPTAVTTAQPEWSPFTGKPGAPPPAAPR